MINKEEMKKRVKKNNKGFSLVELIVVIAIMAVLVGVVGTQVLPYIEKSKQAKDEQIISAICTATLTAFSQNAGDLDANATYTISNFVSAPTASDKAVPNSVTTDLATLTGYANDAAVATKMESKEGKTLDKIVITYNSATGAVTVTPYKGSNTILKAASAK